MASRPPSGDGGYVGMNRMPLNLIRVDWCPFVVYLIRSQIMVCGGSDPFTHQNDAPDP